MDKTRLNNVICSIFLVSMWMFSFSIIALSLFTSKQITIQSISMQKVQRLDFKIILEDEYGQFNDKFFFAPPFKRYLNNNTIVPVHVSKITNKSLELDTNMSWDEKIYISWFNYNIDPLRPLVLKLMSVSIVPKDNSINPLITNIGYQLNNVQKINIKDMRNIDNNKYLVGDISLSTLDNPMGRLYLQFGFPYNEVYSQQTISKDNSISIIMVLFVSMLVSIIVIYNINRTRENEKYEKV